ncbi:MAG: hypothetical protein HW394_1550, partial [Acidobacteria bacterium]|nr:hypothetical protein [Acidobacteriota bacterium]
MRTIATKDTKTGLATKNTKITKYKKSFVVFVPFVAKRLGVLCGVSL